MPCNCCQLQLNSGMIKKTEPNTGAIYKSCPHCTAVNGSEHVFHRYPAEFTNTSARVTATNPDGHQSYCTPCRNLARHVPSSNYVNGVQCSNLI